MEDIFKYQPRYSSTAKKKLLNRTLFNMETLDTKNESTTNLISSYS